MNDVERKYGMGRTHCTLNPQGLFHLRIRRVPALRFAGRPRPRAAAGLESLPRVIVTFIYYAIRRLFSIVPRPSIEGLNSSSLADMGIWTEASEEVNKSGGRDGRTGRQQVLACGNQPNGQWTRKLTYP